MYRCVGNTAGKQQGGVEEVAERSGQLQHWYSNEA